VTEAPDARELFRLLRKLMRESGNTGIILRDPEGDLYLAADPDLDVLCSRVMWLRIWKRRQGREPDVMADTGEIVLDFKPYSAPPCDDSR
jgi:hypothetical protein